MDIFGNVYGLFICKVSMQAVCKWLKCSDVNESFFFFYSDLFNEPIHKTGLNDSVRMPLESATQRLTEPRTVTDFSILVFLFMAYLYCITNTTSSILIVRSVRIQCVFFEHDRVAVIRVNYLFNRTVWFEHVRFVMSRNPMSVLIGWDDFGGNPEFDWLGESKLLE